MDTKNKLIVALDFSDLNEVEKIVKKIAPVVKIFKVGKELFTSVGKKGFETGRQSENVRSSPCNTAPPPESRLTTGMPFFLAPMFWQPRRGLGNNPR